MSRKKGSKNKVKSEKKVEGTPEEAEISQQNKVIEQEINKVQ